MKNKFIVLIIAAFILSLAVVAPVLNAARSAPAPAIPFVGMSMVYYGNANWIQFIQRSVTVVKYNAQNNSVLIQDAQLDLNLDYYTVDIATRNITWATGWFSENCVGPGICAVEMWIPTNVKIGSSVYIGRALAQVVGSKVVSVEGKPVDCWQLHYEGLHDVTGNPTENNWYYAKSNGLWIGASWYELNVNGDVVYVVNHWTGYLASTNVPL